MKEPKIAVLKMPKVKCGHDKQTLAVQCGGVSPPQTTALVL